MALLTDSLTIDLIIIALLLLAVLYWRSTANFDYWKKRGVPFIEPVPFVGNILDRVLHKMTTSEAFAQIYRKLDGHKFGGLFVGSTPNLILRDPDLIKHVMTKDFPYFHDRNSPSAEKAFPLAEHLVVLTGSRWRKLRVKLTPTFTSGKMKMMLPSMLKSSEELKNILNEAADREEIIEAKDIAAKFTTDIIGSCAFGIQTNSIKDPNSEFRQMGREIFEPTKLSGILNTIMLFYPWLISVFRPKIASKHVNDFFIKVVKEMIDYRKQHNIAREDFLQLLIQLKNKGKVDEDHSVSKEDEPLTKHIGMTATDESKNDDLEITDKLLASQCFVFFLAGFETSSNAISCCLHELACNPDIQERVAQEINEVLDKNDGKITYEAIQDMKYLDLVIKETLRKNPPVGTLPRICTKPYKIPGTSITIEKNTRVVIPVYALHHDPKYYPNPEKFDPERFNDENIKSIPQYSYLPFGEGPRICIGMRFGLLETKLGLVTLLSKYKFNVCERTIIPLKLTPTSRATFWPCDIWLKISHRGQYL